MKRHLYTFPGQTPAEPAASLLTRLDHRTLLAVWGIFITALISVTKFDLIRALSFAAFPVFVITVTRIPVLIILRRLAFLSPFIIIMAAANPFLDRTVITTIRGIPLTGGMLSAGVIITKAMLALTAMIVLDRCISIGGLCNALRRFGVPAVFTTQLLLLHRYAYLIISEAATMLKARDMRSFGKRGKGPLNTANLIGTLLLRCAERSERIYRAMLARGFTGTLPATSDNRFGSADLLFIGITVCGFVFLRFIL